jgi:hypothetical protein
MQEKVFAEPLIK